MYTKSINVPNVIHAVRTVNRLYLSYKCRTVCTVPILFPLQVDRTENSLE